MNLDGRDVIESNATTRFPELQLEDVIENVTQDFANSTGSIDYSYQNEKWYRTTLAVSRTVNLLLCFVLIALITTGGL